MKISQFGEAVSKQLNATAKAKSSKVTKEDVIQATLLADRINHLGFRARTITLNGVVFPLEELLWPECMKEMIYPAVYTANGDADNEKDFLTHSYESIIVNEDDYKPEEGVDATLLMYKDLKPLDGYELVQFAKKVYGSWKEDAKTVKVSDLRLYGSMTPESIKVACHKGEVSAWADRNFPIAVSTKLISEEVTTEDADRILNKWILDRIDSK